MCSSTTARCTTAWSCVNPDTSSGDPTSSSSEHVPVYSAVADVASSDLRSTRSSPPPPAACPAINAETSTTAEADLNEKSMIWSAILYAESSTSDMNEIMNDNPTKD